MARQLRMNRWELKDMSSMGLATLIQHFEIHNKSERKSPKTVSWYNQVLNRLLLWLSFSYNSPAKLVALERRVVGQARGHLLSSPTRAGFGHPKR